MIAEVIRRNEKFTIGFDGHGSRRRKFEPQETAITGPIPVDLELTFNGEEAGLSFDGDLFDSETRLSQEPGDRVTIFFGFPEGIKGAENKSPIGATIEYEIL